MDQVDQGLRDADLTIAPGLMRSTPEQFAEFLKLEIPKWAKIVKDAGVKPQ